MISTIQSVKAALKYLGESLIKENSEQKYIDATKIVEKYDRLYDWKAKIKLWK